MATDLEVRDARSVIRHLQSRSTRRHSRVHSGADDENADRIRALEGKCGHCVYLVLNFNHQDGRDIVKLRCREGQEPVTLYQNTDLGKEANCPKFKER
jgi:hypothetical protein